MCGREGRVCVCGGGYGVFCFCFLYFFVLQGHATIIKTCWKIYERRQRQRTNRTNRPTTGPTGPSRANEPRPRGHWGPCERQLSLSAGHVPVPLPVYHSPISLVLRSSIAHPLATTRACLFMLCPPLKSLVVVRVKNFWQCNGFTTWAAVGSCSRCGSNTGHSCGPIKSERTHDQVDKSQLHYGAQWDEPREFDTNLPNWLSSCLPESVYFAVKTL